MKPALERALLGITVLTAAVGAVVLGLLSYRVNGDPERALLKGCVGLVVLLVLGRSFVWVLRPWSSQSSGNETRMATEAERHDIPLG